jgi:hypothetical protein
MTSHSLRALPAVTLSAVALAATGCGGSAATKTSASTTHKTTTAATSRAHGASLSGKWSGQYGGAYSGAFDLSWRQAGSNLSGTIDLSAPSGTLAIHGKLSGSSIQFGTVGSTTITYSGTVSGGSMSGSYQAPGGGGSWSASKA